MNLIKKIFYGIGKRCIYCIGKCLPDTVDGDAAYLRLLYRFSMHKKLNLQNPQAYTEKLQWLKLYNRRPEYTMMVDKAAVKDYVASVIGAEHIIPTIGVWDSFDEIDFDKLPQQFVLKCTHDSGGLVICTDKSKLDYKAARKKIEHALRRNYYSESKEWPYKNVKPRIIAEKYMVDESGYELKDYKFFVFNGKARTMFIATDREAETETCFDFFDCDFHHLPVTNGHPNAEKTIERPSHFEDMIEIAEKLGKDIPHVRVDLYNINGTIYFGEMTFFHWSGFVPFSPEEWDYRFGSWLTLPESKV